MLRTSGSDRGLLCIPEFIIFGLDVVVLSQTNLVHNLGVLLESWLLLEKQVGAMFKAFQDFMLYTLSGPRTPSFSHSCSGHLHINYALYIGLALKSIWKL